MELRVALDGEEPSKDTPISIPLSMLNRHGLVAGATGTDKTVTLQVRTERLSKAGVPVFASDIKGDLSDISAAGVKSGLGTPLRVSVTSFGPILLSKVLELNDTQESVLSLVFHYADQAGLALLDLSDLKAVLTFLTSAEAKADLEGIGGASKALKATVQTFPKSDYDLEELLTSLGIGEAVATVMESDDAPTPVAPTRMRAPESKTGPLGDDGVKAAAAASPQQAKYGTAAREIARGIFGASRRWR